MLASVMAVAVCMPHEAFARTEPAKSSAKQAKTKTTSKVAAKQKASNQKVAQASAKPKAKVASKQVAKTRAKDTRVAAKPKRDAGLRNAALAASDNRAVRPLVVRTNPSAQPSATMSGMVAAAGGARASFGQMYGLHHTPDPLALQSSVALVMDQDTNEVVFAKNTEAVLPIASLTKLMTALVTVEAHLSDDEEITITHEDVDTLKNSSSRLAVGTTLTRGELLHLALMSSENRAAHALGRTYPGGLHAFTEAMNAKARALGMIDTKFVDPTGLSSGNQASAKDLASLVKATYQHPLIRDLSVWPEHAVNLGRRQLQYRNTNSLVRSPDWDIGLQKTGYIVEAGRCLVMQARMAGRKFIMVFLDSSGKNARQADAERVRRWIESAPMKEGIGALDKPVLVASVEQAS